MSDDMSLLMSLDMSLLMSDDISLDMSLLMSDDMSLDMSLLMSDDMSLDTSSAAVSLVVLSSPPQAARTSEAAATVAKSFVLLRVFTWILLGIDGGRYVVVATPHSWHFLFTASNGWLCVNKTRIVLPEQFGPIQTIPGFVAAQ
jgi:hypothetical protein